MINSLSQLDLNKEYSVEDYFSWNIKERFEIIKGKIFKMTPAPSYDHQKISVQLTGYFWNNLSGRSCEVLSAPIDVIFENRDENNRSLKETVVQPDIIVVCDKEKLKTKGCFGAPDLVVEILSPSTSKKDLSDKFTLYEENGVKEYWVVYPSDSTIQIYSLKDDQYELLKEYNTCGELLTSTVLSDLEILIDNVFEGLKSGNRLQEPDSQREYIRI